MVNLVFLAGGCFAFALGFREPYGGTVINSSSPSSISVFMVVLLLLSKVTWGLLLSVSGVAMVSEFVDFCAAQVHSYQ